MINDYYYYRQLSQTEKTLYQALYNGVLRLQKEIPVSGISADSHSLDRVYHAVTRDCPHFYYFNQSVLNLRKSGSETVFLPQYFCSREQVDVYNARLETAVNTLIRDLRIGYASEGDKVRRVHDYFCRNVAYDQEALCTGNVDRLVSAHSVTGVFARQRAVCEGISKAVKLLLNAAGMKCIVVSGVSTMEDGGPHAWNIVKINGMTYHLDVTWDLTTSDKEKDEIQYDYYNLTDAQISRDHSGFSGVPACHAAAEDYFIRNHLDFQNKEDLRDSIRRGVADGQTRFYFRYSGKEGIEQLLPEALDYLREEVFRRRYGSIRLISSMNRTQGTGRVAYEIRQNNQ